MIVDTTYHNADKIKYKCIGMLNGEKVVEYNIYIDLNYETMKEYVVL